MISIEDYILVDRGGKLFKVSIETLQSIFLPIMENDHVSDLEEKIDDLSSFLIDLSAEVVETFTPIEELNDKYEQKVSSDFILEDPAILQDDEIEKLISEQNFVTKDKVDNSYDKQIDSFMNSLDSAQNSITNVWIR